MRRPTRALRSRLSLMSTAPRSSNAFAAPLDSSSDVVDAIALETLASEDDGVCIIAGILPVPRTINAAMRGVLETALLLQYQYSEDLDQFIHSSNDRLGGATPFERLLAGDGMAVLRALRDVPINQPFASAVGDTGAPSLSPAEEDDMRLVS